MPESQKKILLVFGTRPEIIKLAPVIQEFEESGLNNKLLIINTNQHERLSASHLDYWKIKADIKFSLKRNGNQLTSLFTQTLNQLQSVIDHNPSLEYILVQGDTNTALACSHVAYFNRLKLLHIEAGLRTNELYNPYPEEFNRRIASIVAYHHFAPTEKNKTDLVKEGVNADSITVAGNTVIDALQYTFSKLNLKSLKDKTKILVTLHRREVTTSCILNLLKALSVLQTEFPNHQVHWIHHPNNTSEIQKHADRRSNIIHTEHLEYVDLIKAYCSTALVITDSGGVTEEVVHLGIPVVVYREFTERREPYENDYPMIITKDRDKIIEFARNTVHKTHKSGVFYGTGNSSKTIVNWLENQVDITQ